jgi:CHAT domain-containing protein
MALYEKTKHSTYQKRAFEYIEWSKSLVLLEAVQESNAKKIAGIPDTLLLQELRLEQEVAGLEKKIFQSEDEKQRTQLRIELVKAKRQLELLIRQLERENQGYHKLKYNTQLLDIQKVQQQLIPDPQTAFLEYFVGEQAVYVVVITQSQAQLITLKKDFPLNDWVEALRKSYTNYHLAANQTESAYLENCKAISSLSFQIYTHIFEPVEAVFPLPKKLIIVPDGILGYIPFDALIKKQSTDPTLHKQHHYLIRDYQISYVYSASLLKEMKERKTNSTKGLFLGFAPIFGSSNPPITARFSPNRNTLNEEVLSPLKYNIPEVEQLQKLLGGKIIVGEQATVATFEQQAPFYKIIHLATHGKANDEAGDYAYLAFTEVADTLGNKKLYNRDLYHLNLNADMVVLSACETGIGELRLGEGIISLARGFSYAGAKSIITTLWSVDDETTQKLMTQFYTYLKLGMTKDEALQKAKIDLLNNNSNLKAHPFYWATFIPIGDMKPIEQQSSFLTWVWLSLLAAFSLLVLYVWRKKFSVAS